MAGSMKLCIALTICLSGVGVAGAQVQQGGTASGQKNYAVDGRVLGTRLGSGNALRDYKCGPSEQFNGFTWCQRSNREFSWRGVFETNHSILHAKDGTVVYINRHQQPAFLGSAEAEREIQRYTRLLGESAKITKIPRRAGTPDATIATWGGIVLEPLDGDSVKLLAEGKSPRKGFLIDYLGNLAKSAQDGLPIFRIQGSAGFAWAASFDQRGRGTFRLVAIDASAFQPEPSAAPQPSAQATGESNDAQTVNQPAPVRQDAPAPVGEVRSEPESTIARLQSELSSVLREKAEAEQARLAAEDAARLARADADAARKEMQEARFTASAAVSEPSQGAANSYLNGSNSHVNGMSPVSLALGAAAILFFGLWLSARFSARRAAQRASGEAAVPLEEGDGISPPLADQMESSIDQEGLVKELGKRLGLEEETIPLAAEAVAGDVLDPAEPAPEPEPVAVPQIAVVIPSEQTTLDPGANPDPGNECPERAGHAAQGALAPQLPPPSDRGSP